MAMVAARVKASDPSPSKERSALRHQQSAGIHLMNVAAISIVALDLSRGISHGQNWRNLHTTSAARLRHTPVLAVQHFDCAGEMIAISYQMLTVPVIACTHWQSRLVV
jgi:hypothetical protein